MIVSRAAMKFFANGVRKNASDDLSNKTDFEVLRDLAVAKGGVSPDQVASTKGGMEITAPEKRA
jgi:hypothetical protein